MVRLFKINIIKKIFLFLNIIKCYSLHLPGFTESIVRDNQSFITVSVTYEELSIYYFGNSFIFIIVLKMFLN